MAQPLLCPRCSRGIDEEDVICPFCNCALDTFVPEHKSSRRKTRKSSTVPVPAFMRAEAMEGRWSPSAGPESSSVKRWLVPMLFLCLGGYILYEVMYGRPNPGATGYSYPETSTGQSWGDRFNSFYNNLAEFTGWRLGVGSEASAVPEPESGTVIVKVLPPDTSAAAPAASRPIRRRTPAAAARAAAKPRAANARASAASAKKNGTKRLKWSYRGGVYDAATLRPIVGVRLVFSDNASGKKFVIYSIANGQFNIELPAAGAAGYKLRLTHARYYSAYRTSVYSQIRSMSQKERLKMAGTLAKAWSDTATFHSGKGGELRTDFFLAPRPTPTGPPTPIPTPP